jgi:hypothetical protein
MQLLDKIKDTIKWKEFWDSFKYLPVNVTMKRVPKGASKATRQRMFVEYIDRSNIANPWYRMRPEMLEHYRNAGGKGYYDETGRWMPTIFKGNKGY